jgi:hypothetical protein
MRCRPRKGPRYDDRSSWVLNGGGNTYDRLGTSECSKEEPYMVASYIRKAAEWPPSNEICKNRWPVCRPIFFFVNNHEHGPYLRRNHGSHSKMLLCESAIFYMPSFTRIRLKATSDFLSSLEDTDKIFCK